MAARKASALDDTGWVQVSSSNVARARHLGAPSNTMLIRFRSGAAYAWYDVPRFVWHRFLAAASKGKFVHRVLEGEYGVGEKVAAGYD